MTPHLYILTQRCSRGARSEVRIQHVASRPVSAVVYGLYVRQRPDAQTEVFSLDYGDRLRVFDAQGRQRSSKHWSSKVRCIAVGDIGATGHDSLVGGVGKRLLVVDHRGAPVWNMRLESEVLACDARDVDGDDAAEVVAALQNRRVVLWNHDRTALFSRTFDNPLADVWLEDITNDSELEVVVADRRGNVHIVTAAGYLIRTLTLNGAIRVFGVLTFGERKLFVTGDLSPTLRLWDLNGVVVGSLQLSAPPRALATGTPDDVSDTAYLVVSTGDLRVHFWRLVESSELTHTERRILDDIGSTKTTLYRRVIRCGNCGAPTSPEASRCESCGAVLEVMDEYVVEESIRESIAAVLSKHHEIPLPDLDCLLRRTLPQPAAYNLRRGIQSMVKQGMLDGYFDGPRFVVSEPPAVVTPPPGARVSVEDLQRVVDRLLSSDNSLDLHVMAEETGIPVAVLRRTLLILLGDGAIDGTLSQETFTVAGAGGVSKLVEALAQELRV